MPQNRNDIRPLSESSLSDVARELVRYRDGLGRFARRPPADINHSAQRADLYSWSPPPPRNQEEDDEVPTIEDIRIIDDPIQSYTADVVRHLDSFPYPTTRSEMLLPSGLISTRGKDTDGKFYIHPDMVEWMYSGTVTNYTNRAPGYTGNIALAKESLHPNSRLYGIELEVERISPTLSQRNSGMVETPSDITKQVYASMPGCVILKSDGSLNNGFEIVSAPATLGAHRFMWTPFFFGSYATPENNHWKKLLEHPRTSASGPAQHLASYRTTTCGMHIHVSIASLGGVVTLNKLWDFFNNRALDKYLQRIAGRPLTSYCQQHQVKFTECTSVQRYAALNLQNQKTAEFRIFRGNTHPLGFMKNLDFVDSFIDFVQTHSLRDINGVNYIQWLDDKKAKQQWPFLTRWLQHHRIHLIREAGLKKSA